MKQGPSPSSHGQRARRQQEGPFDHQAGGSAGQDDHWVATSEKLALTTLAPPAAIVEFSRT
jgi:hypothetical protein